LEEDEDGVEDGETDGRDDMAEEREKSRDESGQGGSSVVGRAVSVRRKERRKGKGLLHRGRLQQVEDRWESE
jgi:hypothetical protein